MRFTRHSSIRPIVRGSAVWPSIAPVSTRLAAPTRALALAGASYDVGDGWRVVAGNKPYPICLPRLSGGQEEAGGGWGPEMGAVVLVPREIYRRGREGARGGTGHWTRVTVTPIQYYSWRPINRPQPQPDGLWPPVGTPGNEFARNRPTGQSSPKSLRGKWLVVANSKHSPNPFSTTSFQRFAWESTTRTLRVPWAETLTAQDVMAMQRRKASRRA